jgi:hypothetical protein
VGHVACVSNSISYALPSGVTLFEVCLSHKVLHVLSVSRRKDNASVFLIDLDVRQVLPLIAWVGPYLEKVLVSCLVVALAVILAALSSKVHIHIIHLGDLNILLLHLIYQLSPVHGCSCLLVLNQISNIIHLLLVHHILLLILLCFPLISFPEVSLGLVL